MKLARQAHIPAGMSQKKEALALIYRVYSRWADRFPLACKKGCAACCTQSVTMTSLEGEAILDLARSRGREQWLHGKLIRTTPGNGRPYITTNQFAEACLARQAVDGELQGTWDFSPCIFLDDTLCSIYEARPFGCRSFGSFVECAADRAAEILPIHLAVNTVFTQIIEHIDSDGGTWAIMRDILQSLTGSNRADAGRTHLPLARPLPGFLLDDHEFQVVNNLLRQLYQESGGNLTFGDLIDNFMTI